MKSIKKDKYEMEVKTSEKTMVVTLEGFFQEKDAESFAKDYQKLVEQIKATDYVLIVDSSDMKIVKNNLISDLKEALAMYMKTGFKQIIMVNPNKITAKKRLHNIAEECGFEGEFSDSLKTITA